jgi:CheY-like chemotaxis protein
MNATLKCGNPRKRVILCVDDEENPLMLRKRVLQKAGYHVLTARSGTEGLQIAATEDVDLVLSDYLMPSMNGAEFAARIKALYPQIPVMLLSGVNEIPPNSYLADAFLSKIEGPDNLCQYVAEFLKSKSL